MSLMYYPKLGEILLCDFSGFIVPEMVKRRPVIVIVPRLSGRGDLVTIVPLSTTAPNPQMAYHVHLTLSQALPNPFSAQQMWAKCDMAMPVARARLDRFKDGRASSGGKRKFVSGNVSPKQLADIRAAVLRGLGF
jgi:mRNA interferase MazF